jgi:hypothetical protein
MQWALQLAAGCGFELALMIQEDMQLVRDILARDIDVVAEGFARPHSSFVIQTCFLKANRGRRVDDAAMYEVFPGRYERKKLKVL